MMRIHPVPAFSDNYLWVLEDGRHAAVVDPGDEEPIEAFLAGRGLTLAAILVTHHHGDHTGGVEALAAHWSCEVFGPAGERIKGLTKTLREGDRITVPGLELALSVLDVPGHTAGHIAYYGDATPVPNLFCGDTLFACGCGRLFEGTPAQMADSLAKLARLPGETRVHCAHEYTMSNIRFALAVEPGNAKLSARRDRDAARRAHDEPTLPCTIADERETNPFMRCESPEVIASASRHAGRALASPVEVFAELRQWKNDFR
jgi:hydroxyacylglutathione hydrolase